MSTIDEVKKIVKEGNIIIGTNSVIKNLKLGKLSKVYVTINCPTKVKEDIERYAKISGTEIVQLKVPNDELGIVCRKNYAISILGLLK